MQLYALRRDTAAGPRRACWRLQVRSDVETQIQHPHIRLDSHNAETHGVALCFDTSCVHLSIGPRLFLPSEPEQCSTFLSVCLISTHPPDKGLCPRGVAVCVLTVARRLSSSSLLRPPFALCVLWPGGLILHAYIVLLNNSALAVRGEGEPVARNLSLCAHQVPAKATVNLHIF